MTRVLALLVLMVSGCVASPGGDNSMDARLFGDAMTGRSMDFYLANGDEWIYGGSQRFLVGNRTVLLQNGCYEGSWERVGQQICFTYPDLLTQARHCYSLTIPTHPEGVVALSNRYQTFEMRNTNRSVPASCPR